MHGLLSDHRLTAAESSERTRRKRLPLVAMSSRTRVFFFPPPSYFWFWVVFKWMMKKALCTQDIWSGKKMERDGKRQGCNHGPQKLTCQKERKKNRRVPHALPILFSINLLLLGKHACFRETTFVTFSPFTDLPLQLWRQERPSWHRGTKWRIKGGLPVWCFTSFADSRQLMNDLFVTLTQIENCRRSRVLLASQKDCWVNGSLQRIATYDVARHLARVT